ncbi:hypothetical protein [Mycolicibacterium gilvum]|uniref:hypothetical protein n=1 Tax=Mycolicibacterium gilvum TaxID=1804 RepID=UPI004045A421
MNRADRRAARIKPRPQLIPEQTREQFAGIPKILNYEQCLQYVVMLGGNLSNHLNNRRQLPFVQSSIEQRTDGFSLHVQVIKPTGENDAVVLG